MFRHFTLPTTLPINWDLVRHTEAPLRLTQSRHPIVVWMNASSAGAFAMVWSWNSDNLSWPSHLYFFVLCSLYASSAFYHHFSPTKVSRIVDQSAISAYVLVTVLPFVYHSFGAVSFLGFLLVVKLLIKIFDRESDSICSFLFLATGTASVVTYATCGVTNSGVLMNWPFMISVSLFCLKLYVYTNKLGRFVPDYFDKEETAHSVLLPAASLFTFLVLTDAPL